MEPGSADRCGIGPAARFARAAALALLFAVPQAQAQVFYSVESDDGKLSWLLGTVHTEDSRVLDFPPALLEVVEQADRLALELVPDQDMLGELNRAMNLQSGQRLEDLIPDALYRQVVEALGEYGMESPAINRMQPWAAAMTLSLPPPETGLFMDLALAFRAARAGTPVSGLETLDEQLDFLIGLGPEAHVRMLESAVADFDGERELFEDLITAYLDGDLERLQTLAESELDAMGEDVREQFRQKGIIDRNRTMAERARPMIEEGGVLIAVGALHLPGERGLIALLREQGFRVEAID